MIWYKSGGANAQLYFGSTARNKTWSRDGMGYSGTREARFYSTPDWDICALLTDDSVHDTRELPAFYEKNDVLNWLIWGGIDVERE